MESEVVYWYLRNHNLFDQMTEQEYLDLCVISGYKTAKKNELIYMTQESVKRLYFLKKGVVKIAVINEDGAEITKDVMQEGDIFGEIASSERRTENREFAKAISDEVSICSFKLEDFERLLEKNPNLSLRYTRKVGDKFKAMETRFSNLIFKDVRARLIDFLKDTAKQSGIKKGNELVINNYLTHQDIASIIGASRQTVTSLLNEMEKQNCITYTRNEIIIQDLTKLN
ncbi:MAG: Crp/Fnr family transcriptional regulator [Bacteroidetes bacterium]|nr:Crp/Fnr family transcriptional regulator [Bacteroidota bacterium]